MGSLAIAWLLSCGAGQTPIEPAPVAPTILPAPAELQHFALSAPDEGPVGLGTPVDPAYYAAWDITILPDGTGLPPGTGTAALGEPIFAAKCEHCHGPAGRHDVYCEGPEHEDRYYYEPNFPHYPDLQGGSVAALSREGAPRCGGPPLKTIGSYWPHATTIFDYVRRAMPFWNPQSLTDDEVYALTAYLLHINGLAGRDQVIDAGNLASIEMPNRDGFVPDDRPDVAACAGEGCPEIPVESRCPETDICDR